MQVGQLAINGIAVGAIYALIALGMVLTYKATEVLSFAHGDLLMFSTFVAWALIVGLGAPFWLAALATIALLALLAGLLEAGVMRRIVGQPQFASVLLTIAIAFMLRGATSMIFGPESRSYPTPWTGQTVQLGPLVVNELSLVILAAAVVVTLVLFWFLRRTSLGVSVQAASQNQLAAFLCGIRVKRLNTLIWALSGALAALCGVLLAAITLVDTGLWIVLLKALAALVLGGFGSIPGAIVGGLVIGLIEQFSGVYLMEGAKDIVSYVVLIGVLMVWPRGLLGEASGRRV
ncbi:MAG: branched-chain amino acid ABC transporter permease [Burkholderiaceae bacterium]|nr:branched-chain amino acid ABC transporter permease [Burkholderiaceae bacterium]